MFKELPNIGIVDSHSLFEIKIRRWFNIMSVSGILVAITQAVFFSSQDILSSVFHLVWGVACVIGLLLHAHHNFNLARFVVCSVTLIFGGLASARIGQEYYPHFASFGILVAVFIFYDLKKEWRIVLFFLALEIMMLIIVESNYLKADAVFFKHPNVARSFMLIGTVLFVCFEIWYLVRLSWINENYINTALQRSNDKLVKLNVEKAVMLQEIHHRVKNNFQIISSLTKLQSAKLVSQESKAIFDDLCNRIMSISMMHEQIYQSENMAKIDFKEYVESLVNRITESYRLENPIDIKIASEIKSMNNQSIVPVALIFNELITNSLKHAFTDTDSPKILISFERVADGRSKLVYKDNGQWKEQSVESTLGLDLVSSLTEQLSGSFTREVDESGTQYSFVFDDKID